MITSVLYQPGNIQVKKVEIPLVGENEALIRVKYCGICGSDLPRAMNKNGARYYPIILGHEISGVVECTGNNVKRISPGDLVTVAPLIPCGKCIYCKKSKYGLCLHYKIIGTGMNGGFSEFVKVPSKHLIKLPNDIDLINATGIEPAT